MNIRSVMRAGALAGVVGVAGNIAGVVWLADIPSAYRPDAVAEWTVETLASPLAASLSGVSFTIGLLALAAWSVAVAARLGTPVGWGAALVLGTGAVVNAAGTLAPLVVVHLLTPACGPTPACEAASMALLGTSLALDALFNLLLGAGLVLFGWSVGHGPGPRWLAVGLMAAGAASVPVSLQIVSPIGADLLLLAAPLWLIAITVVSARMWRGRL